MTKTDAAVQTLSDINPDVVLEVNTFIGFLLVRGFITYVKLYLNSLSAYFRNSSSLLAWDP
jgi:hypothetical protein